MSEEKRDLPIPLETSALPPPKLSPLQEELCKKLDVLHTQGGLATRPSDMFRGAVFAAQRGFRNNPDWMAQVAHSLRDILYPFSGKLGPPKREEALKQYGSVFVGNYDGELGRIFGTLTLIAHHGNGRGTLDYAAITVEEFERLVSDFEQIMFDVLKRQIDLHSEIDQLLAIDPANIIFEDPALKQKV